jgi:predicted secreted hydrolase
VSDRGRALGLLAAVAIAASGCTNGGILRAPVPTPIPTGTPGPSPATTRDPQPLAFPRDEGPHRRLTEWWYYTGHLRADDGRAFGFEFVVFRAERGDFPVAWASHFAITDGATGSFTYDQRAEYGPQVDRSSPEGGFDLALQTNPALASPGAPPLEGPIPPPVAWTMRGLDGHDHLSAINEAAWIDLELSTDRPPVLHDGDGWIDLGPAGGTYYYSRTRMDVAGTLSSTDDPSGRPVLVSGLAWFDHQWGDFIAVGAGGWDWFSVQLDDGRDLTISLVHGPGGVEFLRYGTLVAADGTFRTLAAEDIGIDVLGRWRSPGSGADYPALWNVRIPSEGLSLRITPVIADQELDTTASSGVVYWEGESTVTGTDDGVPVGGLGYVELTGYAAP